MKKVLVLFILLLVVSGCTVSKRTLYLELPTESSVTEGYPINFAEYEQKYKNYDGVYLEHVTKYEHSGIKENLGLGPVGGWNFTIVSSFRYLVLNTESNMSKSTRLWFNPDNFYLRIISPDGDIKYYKQDSLKKEQEPDGTEYYTIIYPEVSRGSIIEVGYELSFGMGVMWAKTDYDIPLQFSVPCEKIEFTFAYPNWWEIQVKEIKQDYFPDYLVENDDKNKKTVMSYLKYNVPAVTDEPYSPEFKMIVEYLQFMITDMVMSTGSLKRYYTWDEMYKEFYKYFLDDMNNDIKEIPISNNKYQDKKYSFSSFVNHIFEVDEAVTDEEKIQAILEYVRESIEMVYEPKKGNIYKIIKEHEGSIYDITALASRMLKEAGFNNEVALIHSAEDGYYDNYYINNEQFYVPGIRLRMESGTYVLFPFIDDLPYNIIPNHFQGQKAISFVEYDLFDFWETPNGTNAENSMTQTFDVEITEDGTTNVKEEIVFEGYNAFSMRLALNLPDSTDMDDIMKKMITYDEGEAKNIEYELINMDKPLKSLILKFNYTIDNLVTITPEEIIVQTSGFFHSTDNNSYKYNKDLRTNPIQIHNNEKFIQIINVTFPENWNLITELIPSEYENIFGLLKWSTETNENTVSFKKDLTLKQTYQPKTEYQEFLKIYGDENDFNLPALIFSNKIEESQG